MIENIRKYTGLMIVVFVVLFVSFLLLDTSSVQNIGGGGAVIRIDGRSYDEKEFRSVGQNGYELTQQFLRSGEFSVYQFLLAATDGASQEGDDAAEKFFVTRILLRDAAREFGLHPAEAEISSYIRTLRIFTGADGDFDSRTYSTFIERGIGRLGMTESDVRDLASDILVFNKLNSIIGSGLKPVRDAVQRSDAFENQKITGSLVKLELASYESEINPTDEEVRAFWENLQDAFKTEPRRKFTYVVVKPELPELLSEDVELPPIAFGDLALSEEEREERDAKYMADQAAERSKKNAEIAEQRRTAQLASDTLVDDFLYNLEQEKDTTFEKLAEENGWEVHVSDLFPQSAPPENLDTEATQSSRGSTVAEVLFSMITTTDPFSKISPPIRAGEGTYIVARLDEVELSRVKDFEEAKDEARTLYITEKSAEAMTAAAEAAAAKIKEVLADGESFQAAAVAAGIQNVHSFTEINSAHQPDAALEPANLFEAAGVINPGEISDLVREPERNDRVFIIHVEKREIVKEEAIAQRIDSRVTQSQSSNAMTAFVAWMRGRVESASVQPLYRR